MFKFEGKSPAEQFANIVKIWLLLCVVTFGGCAAGFHFDKPYTESTSHNATLEQAYSSMQGCGKHKSCEEFMGRFKLEEDGKMYNREIDGFFYHSFVDKGRQPMAAYITLNKNDKGVETPLWIRLLMFNGALCAFIFLGGGLCLLFGGIDVEYEQRKWDEAKEREERNVKWRNM